MPAALSHPVSNLDLLPAVGRAEGTGVTRNAVHDVLADAVGMERPGTPRWHLLRAALALVDQAIGSRNERYTDSSASR